MKNDTSTNFHLIPERLINVRTKLNITKAEAARRLNLSKMGYGRYESGERDPSPQMIKVIAEGLDTSVDYLIGASEHMSSDQIIISQKDSPELFAFIESCRNSDVETIKRLYAYYVSLKN